MPRLLDTIPQGRRPPKQVKPGTAPGQGGSLPGAFGGGQPPFVATAAQRAQVTKLVACGFTNESISVVTQIPHATLERHFANELQHGKTLVDARILTGIVDMAFESDKTMMIFYAKARAGWRDMGKDGDGATPASVFSINITHGPSNGENERAQGITIQHMPREDEP